MKTEVYNLKNERVGEIELPENIFGVRWRPSLVKQVVKAQLANRRRPWAHTKSRGEVRGGGKKPWRQKGTGRARHGSIRSPIWVGGGKAHGPRKERDYSQKVNKKMKRQALFSVLSQKLREGEIKVVSDLNLPAAKTKVAVEILESFLGKEFRKTKRGDSLFVPLAENNVRLSRAVRNLAKVKSLPPSNLNVYDLLNYKRVFIEAKAIPEIVSHFAKR